MFCDGKLPAQIKSGAMAQVCRSEALLASRARAFRIGGELLADIRARGCSRHGAFVQNSGQDPSDAALFDQQAKQVMEEVFKRIAELLMSGVQGPYGEPLPFGTALDMVLQEAGVRLLICPALAIPCPVRHSGAAVNPAGSRGPLALHGSHPPSGSSTRNARKRATKVKKTQFASAGREVAPLGYSRVPKNLSGRARTPDGTEICFNFNDSKGCFNVDCVRAHVCMQCCGCHPLFRHRFGERTA